MKKKTDNKGFSLVELIVVIAIMAVLMVVLAPTLLRYVEKARLQKDNSAIAEVANAIKIACADETVLASATSFSKESDTTGGHQEFTFDSTSTNALEKELAMTIGTFTTSSSKYKDATAKLKITVEESGGIISVKVENYYETQDDATSTTKIFK